MALVCTAAPAPAATQGRADFGFGYDLTNFIYYEQSFDSTAFSERNTVDNPVSRLQALLSGILEGSDPGGSRWRLDGRLSAGEKLLQAQAYFDSRTAIGSAWRAVLAGDAQYRDDSSFETAIRDFRVASRVGAERRSEDLSSSWRALYLFDLSQGENADGTDYSPDYTFHRLAISRDHFSWEGREWGLGLFAGHRSFPDTSARNYWDFQLEGRARSGVGARGSVQALGSLERRSAENEAATGDRFWAGDLEVAGHLPVGAGAWSAEGRGAFRGTNYDSPTPTFFHHAIWQVELGARYEELPGWLVRPRAVAEFLRVPEGGGLGDPETDPDARSAVAEEYDQFGGRLDLDLATGAAWIHLGGAFGERNYRNGAADETSLVARSSFWFTEIGGFSEFRLGRWLRLRLSGDLRSEAHEVSSDDLTSLYLATEIHYLFRR